MGADLQESRLVITDRRTKPGAKGYQGMDIQAEVLSLLDEVLSLGGRSATFNAATPLLGAVPELDSMAVATLVTTMEERFGFPIGDDDISAETFATVGSLSAFVAARIA